MLKEVYVHVGIVLQMRHIKNVVTFVLNQHVLLQTPVVVYVIHHVPLDVNVMKVLSEIKMEIVSNRHNVQIHTVLIMKSIQVISSYKSSFD